MTPSKTYRTFDWINRHFRVVLVSVLLAILALGVIGSMVADTDEPNFDPSGEIFDIADQADDTLRSESTLESATFLVESPDGGDVLTATALTEWLAASESVRTTDANGHLVERYNADLETIVPGVLSIADIVDDELPNGLAAASDADVKQALNKILDPAAPTSDFRFTLSEQSTYIDGKWSAPAFTTQVVYDGSTFVDNSSVELWLRDVQATMRDGAVATDSIGVAIDGDTTFEEAAQDSSPFIFLAVALIVLLIAIVHRSYWSSVVVAAGLGSTMLVYYGIAALVGLKMGSLLLAFIVPIAMISFGVDFYIHGSGRVRESQIEDGVERTRAYPAGMAAVFTALLLAVSSSVAAFLSNAASGTEAIIEFGIGSAIALGAAYVILGLVAPRALLALDGYVGGNPTKRWSRPLYMLGQLLVAVIAGLAVTLAAVVPTIGTAAVAGLILLVVLVPAAVARRRNRRALAKGKTIDIGIKGAAHGLKPAGAFVERLARWRVITLPAVIALGLIGLFAALNVRSGFEISDFLASDTDFAQSIERVNEHFPSSGEGSSFVFVEGDLTNPDTLAALDVAVGDLDASDAELGRTSDGELIVGLHAGDVVRMTMASPAAVAEIAANDTALVDSDGNGIPDTTAQVRAIYDYVAANGVPTPNGEIALAADEVAAVFADDGATTQATALVIQVGSFTDADVIQPVHDALDSAALNLENSTTGISAAVSGDVLAQFVSLESFTRSMLVALPLALLLTLVIAAAMLRSLRYAVAAVVPIAFVVTGVYAFMFVAGYTVNVVTATIAAIAVGVGIDFSTHFTARFREELATQPTRLDALRRAGEGTGGALVLSAGTSMLGFTVMALAPTPIFATFGTLTAVMIGLALFVSLVILPSLLMLVSREPDQPEVALEPGILQPIGV